ncbi:MAG: glycogen debranching protein GlgX [Dehalococcoidia bacterium]|nr:glycogen debranching protein GlgX [Dehalococcoidia bacterium]
MATKILPGKPYPLGATWDGAGVNFAIYSENATSVELCLFEEPGQGETERIPLREVTGFVWHCYLPGLQPGQLYGYRFTGPFRPEQGFRFNPGKLLMDPYAKALAGQVDWNGPVFGYQLGHPDADLTFNEEDDALSIPRCVVVNPYFDWEQDRPPRIPWNESIVYEAHIKGATIRHPDLDEDVRGTYAGFASRIMLDYFTELGITAVELMPVHDFLDDKLLLERGLRRYWGYNSIAYFSPTARYSSTGDRGGQVAEFKSMVKSLHRAGIEVILDVVYNHTAEGSEMGPTFSFRGIDNTTYYRLVADQPRYYMDYTGTGNSLNVRHPQVLQLIMDSLRYWVTEMHVDGFRFDLASTLARELHEVDRLSAFFDIIHQDPVISQVKLIAEPWDIGEGGYQVGNFPVLWTEWNGKYRDTVRRFWRGDESQAAELAYRLAGSSDLYELSGRSPFASINFVTAHDGFTLNDLVSYNDKHNEANGEDNRDGTDNNLSWNCGVEGPAHDPAVIELREKQQRNFLCTLLFSQGVPMICGGDEIGRTQRGNNNSYCQDNEINWFDWDLDERRRSLLGFARAAVKIRRDHPGLRRRKFFQGRSIHGAGIKDITWLRGDGHEMTDQEWESSWVRALGMLLAGNALNDVDIEGSRISDDTLLLILNSHHEDVSFTLPLGSGLSWRTVIDTTQGMAVENEEIIAGGKEIEIPARSLLLMSCSHNGSCLVETVNTPAA